MTVLRVRQRSQRRQPAGGPEEDRPQGNGGLTDVFATRRGWVPSPAHLQPGGQADRAARKLSARAELPLNERQAGALILVQAAGAAGLTAAELAARTGHGRSIAAGLLYALTARELVVKRGPRWHAAP